MGSFAMTRLSYLLLLFLISSRKIKAVCVPFSPGESFPPREESTPSNFDYPGGFDIACDLDPTSDPSWKLEYSPTRYWYNIPENVNGVVFLFHGGGGDHNTWLTKTGSSRIITNSILKDLDLGVVSPAASGSGWSSGMCSGRDEGSYPRREENQDIDNLYTIVDNLIDNEIISSTTPIITFGFSAGTNPALEFRTCGPSQVRLAMASGTISTSWYGWNGLNHDGMPTSFGVDDTTVDVPVHLSIGQNDVYKEIFSRLWENPLVPEYINKVTYQQEAFVLLKDAAIESKHCIAEPYPMSEEGKEFQQLCVNGRPIGIQQQKKLRDFFVRKGYIDEDTGNICPSTEDWNDPARGLPKNLLRQAATAINADTSDRDFVKHIGNVITEAYAGHVPLLRCWPQQMDMINEILLKNRPTSDPTMEPTIRPTLEPSVSTSVPTTVPTFVPTKMTTTTNSNDYPTTIDDANSTDAPTSTTSPGGGFCFSENNFVITKDRGWVLMSDLSIGDMVLVGPEEQYDTIYSFGHRGEELSDNVEFLAIWTYQYIDQRIDLVRNPFVLEITKDHMVMMEDGRFIPASMIKKDDILMTGTKNILRRVYNISTVSRKGMYAPFTLSGKIVVYDIVCSNYITYNDYESLYEVLSRLIWIRLPSFHWIAHTFNSFHRLAWRLSLFGEEESYTANGISTWVAIPHEIFEWLLQQNTLLIAMIMIPIMIILSFIAFIEIILVWIITYPILLLILLLFVYGYC